jgi:hypothetical protein
MMVSIITVSLNCVFYSGLVLLGLILLISSFTIALERDTLFGAGIVLWLLLSLNAVIMYALYMIGVVFINGIVS